MKLYKKLIILSLALVFFVAFGASTLADTLYLSQTNIYIATGQTFVVTANNGGSMYLSSNSNTGVATVTINSNSASFYGSSAGNSTVVLCQSGYVASCGTVYVTVGTNYYNNNNNYNNTYGNLGLNISSLTLTAGGYATVTSANYSGALYVSSNSNSSVASVSTSSLIAGCNPGANYSVLTGQPCYATTYLSNNNGSAVISALTAGSTTIVLCQTGGSVCGTLYVTVTGNNITTSSYIYNPGYTYQTYNTGYTNQNYTTTYNDGYGSSIPTIYSN